MLISSETAPGLEALMLRQFLEGDDEQRRDMSKAGSFDLWRETLMQRLSQLKGPSSFRVEPNIQNRWSSSSPVGMWAGCL
jgi:hypothetical protein